MIIVDYMKKRGRYQEAVTIYNDLIQRVRQQGDTLGEMMNTAKWGLAEVYRRMGRGEQAANLFFKNRFISHKNHILVQQITYALKFKDLYLKEKRTQEPKLVATEPDSLTDEQLFKYINKVIVQEKLFLDPNFERQTIIDRFQLSKERVGAVFSKGSDHSKMSNYIQQLRLEYAAKLLIEQPDKSIVQIASDCGFSSNTYFSDRFRKCFGMSPTDFRKVTLHSSYE